MHLSTQGGIGIAGTGRSCAHKQYREEVIGLPGENLVGTNPLGVGWAAFTHRNQDGGQLTVQADCRLG